MTILSAATPAYDHIVVVVEENHGFNDIIGNSQAPYINSLATRGALLTSYHAITHPSQPNYFALYAGSTFGADNNDHQEPDPTLATILQQNGKSFVGFIETGSPRRHNPWESFPEGTSVERNFGSFPTNDFSQLPDVAFVVPNLSDDMHDGSIAQSDLWLQTNIDSYARWAATHNSLLVVVWDEDGGTADNRVPAILFGANVNPGNYSDYATHYDLLKTLLDAFQLGAPNNAATAAGVADGAFYDTTISDAGSDTLTGGPGHDALYGQAGDDVLSGGGSNDSLYGGPGNDMAVYSGPLADYALSYDAATASLAVADLRIGTPNGTDSVTGVEHIQFSDSIVANSFDGAGRLVSQTPDHAATGVAWLSQSWTYDGSGRLVVQTVDNGNGTHWSTSYDAANLDTWAWATTATDPSGHVTSQSGTQDDGTHWLTLYDVANVYPWEQATVAFDANWAVTAVTGTRDSGAQPVTMADIAAAYDTALWFTTPYDVNWNTHHDLFL